MKPIKLLAGLVALASGILAAYTGYVYPAPEGNQLLLESLGVVLIIVSLACLYGANVAFAGSAVVSGLFVLSAWIGWGGGFSGLQLGALGSGVVNTALSALAFKSSTSLPEQANPMNLPVFG
jgi:hypothetical protein